MFGSNDAFALWTTYNLLIYRSCACIWRCVECAFLFWLTLTHTMLFQFPGGYDAGEDGYGVVPSTPKLLVPRREDEASMWVRFTEIVSFQLCNPLRSIWARHRLEVFGSIKNGTHWFLWWWTYFFDPSQRRMYGSGNRANFRLGWLHFWTFSLSALGIEIK